MNIVLFCVEFDNGDSNCYLGDRVPTIFEAEKFCQLHIQAMPEWNKVTDVFEIMDREQAETMWDLSVLKNENWLRFDSKQFECKHCKETDNIISKNIECTDGDYFYDIRFDTENNQIDCMFGKKDENGNDEYICDDGFDIAFCPFCGRDLKAESEVR